MIGLSYEVSLYLSRCWLDTRTFYDLNAAMHQVEPINGHISTWGEGPLWDYNALEANGATLFTGTVTQGANDTTIPIGLSDPTLPSFNTLRPGPASTAVAGVGVNTIPAADYEKIARSIVVRGALNS